MGGRKAHHITYCQIIPPQNLQSSCNVQKKKLPSDPHPVLNLKDEFFTYQKKKKKKKRNHLKTHPFTCVVGCLSCSQPTKPNYDEN